MRVDKEFEKEQFKKIKFKIHVKPVSSANKQVIDCGEQFRKREKMLRNKQNYRENLRNKSLGKPYDCCVISATWQNLTRHIEAKICLECGKILEIRSK